LEIWISQKIVTEKKFSGEIVRGERRIFEVAKK